MGIEKVASVLFQSTFDMHPGMLDLERCIWEQFILERHALGISIWGCSLVCSIEESSVSQNLWVSIVLKASKSAGAKGDVPENFPRKGNLSNALTLLYSVLVTPRLFIEQAHVFH